MKQSFLFALLLFVFCVCVQGQSFGDNSSSNTPKRTYSDRTLNFGAKGGFTSSLFLIPHLTIDGVSVDKVQNNYKLGWFGSLFMRINMGKHFLQPEVSYNVNRGNITFDKPVEEGSLPQKASITSSIHSIDIPILYGYNFIKQGSCNFAFFAGPKLRCILDKQSTVTFDNFNQENIREELRPLNLSATMGVAVTISRIFFDFRYDIGIHNISKRVIYENSIDTTINTASEENKQLHFHRKDNVLSFSLGVFF